jgi:hypothetical protein
MTEANVPKQPALEGSEEPRSCQLFQSSSEPDRGAAPSSATASSSSTATATAVEPLPGAGNRVLEAWRAVRQMPLEGTLLHEVGCALCRSASVSQVTSMVALPLPLPTVPEVWVALWLEDWGMEHPLACRSLFSLLASTSRRKIALQDYSVRRDLCGRDQRACDCIRELGSMTALGPFLPERSSSMVSAPVAL